MEEALAKISSDLALIKWLLVALVFFAAFLATYVSIVFYLSYLFKFPDPRWSSIGNELLDKGQYEDLIRSAQQRLKTHPKDWFAHYYLGRAYLENGDYFAALKTLQQLREWAPEWGESFIDPQIEAAKFRMRRDSDH